MTGHRPTENARLLGSLSADYISRWRDVSGSTSPSEVVNAAKFSVIELVVAAPHRGRGLAGRPLDGRPE